jgi:hypothetical protein
MMDRPPWPGRVSVRHGLELHRRSSDRIDRASVLSWIMSWMFGLLSRLRAARTAVLELVTEKEHA